MLEMKLTITTPDLSEAINNLAQAMSTCVPGIQNGTTTCAEATNTTSAGADAAPAANPTQVTGVPTSAVPVAPAPTSVPVEQPLSVSTAAPAYTLEMIATAGTTLIDIGKMKQLTDLLARYGISCITELDPSQYGAFATELRALGAQI